MKFNARKRAMLMDFVGHPCPIGYIVIVPNPRRRHLSGPVELGCDRCCLGIYDGPASFGLDPPMVGLATGKHVAESGALWSLIEPVAHCLGADRDWFKQDVESLWTAHDHDSLWWRCQDESEMESKPIGAQGGRFVASILILVDGLM